MEVLRSQYAQYPLMQLQDFYKLVYQNEFGYGHSITDSTSAWIYLVKEWNDYVLDLENEQLVEDIGNGFHRINLRPARKRLASPETIFDCYIRSINLMQGSIVSFVDKLLLLKVFFEEAAFGYSQEQLKAFLDDCSEKGFPILPHSEIYRYNYKPSYRVVNSEQLAKILGSMKAC